MRTKLMKWEKQLRPRTQKSIGATEYLLGIYLGTYLLDEVFEFNLFTTSYFLSVDLKKRFLPHKSRVVPDSRIIIIIILWSR